MKRIYSFINLFFVTFFIHAASFAQNIQNNPSSNHGNKFEQLGTLLSSPNEYRTASGAPAEKYWQQKTDYDITCELDEQKQLLSGFETITYTNNSPDNLNYLWLQLDENEHHPKSDNNYFDQSKMRDIVSDLALEQLKHPTERLKGLGVQIIEVKDALGKNLSYTINQTMMRIDLKQTLQSKSKIVFTIKWRYQIPDRIYLNSSRGGYEYFPEDKNYLFTIAQWYPRLCVYSDFQGWQNKQFTGRGEFAVGFGDFKVRMKVPADHVVIGTGECQNYEEVLTPTQLSRWKKAQTTKEPLEIVTLNEAIANSKNSTSPKTKTWTFSAKNVRDFAWTSSRRFVWDALPTIVNNKKIMCMSLYCKEAYPLYRKYSTKTVAHTIQSYSKHTINYPYPVAISVEASNGMEYPMICFNYGRTNADGTYSQAVKYGMISVVIHEVGHNFFPMMINSDERQWSWMDEGLNTFVQYLTEQTFSNRYPSRRGPAHLITNYMRLPKNDLEPIMTNSENIIRFGDNAYGKPAVGLNILRETIMGRELFDHAFKEYTRRWAFKHPTPADFFRTMEDASGVDLDWFWRAWFYSIEPVDISLDSVKLFVGDKETNPLIIKDTMKTIAQKPFIDISRLRNKADKNIHFLVEQDTSLSDFYEHYEPWNMEDSVIQKITNRYEDTLSTETKTNLTQNQFLYELNLSNKGGSVMPILIEWTFKDSSQEIEKVPVEIWRKNELNVKKVFLKNKEVSRIVIDPMKETADINESNNSFPQNITTSKFQLFKAKQMTRNFNDDLEGNPMQKHRKKMQQ